MRQKNDMQRTRIGKGLDMFCRPAERGASQWQGKRPDKQVKRVRSERKRVNDIALTMYHLDPYVQAKNRWQKKVIGSLFSWP